MILSNWAAKARYAVAPFRNSDIQLQTFRLEVNTNKAEKRLDR